MMKRSEHVSPEPSVGVQLAPDLKNLLLSRKVSRGTVGKERKTTCRTCSHCMSRKKPAIPSVPAVKQLLVVICVETESSTYKPVTAVLNSSAAAWKHVNLPYLPIYSVLFPDSLTPSSVFLSLFSSTEFWS